MEFARLQIWKKGFCSGHRQEGARLYPASDERSAWQPQESALREARPAPGLVLGKSGFTGERPEVIGQLHGTYILAQGESGLVIIDQHVAHERILVDKYREEFRKEKPSVQLLLAPEVAEIGASDVEIVSKHADVLARMGYELDVFGETSVVIRGVPAQSGGFRRQNPHGGHRGIVGACRV